MKVISDVKLLDRSVRDIWGTYDCVPKRQFFVRGSKEKKKIKPLPNSKTENWTQQENAEFSLCKKAEQKV